MDGIAINYTNFNNGQTTFTIENIQAAGSPQLTLQNVQNCIEVMTGSVLPNNVDTIIPYELISITNGIATINTTQLTKRQNIHTKGKDNQKGDVLIPKNTLINSATIGVLSTVGKTTVMVAKQPKVIIVSTGDELVKVDRTPLDYQIRRSNAHTLVSLLNELKIQPKTEHISDNKEVLKQKVTDFLKTYDVLLFSGAVSKGKFDFLPEVLEELGVQKSFHKVAQRPGKPFWFGRYLDTERRSLSGVEVNRSLVTERSRSVTVFAFPGNPVSTFVSCLVYFYSWYYKSVGFSSEIKTAILGEDITFKPELTYFLQVKLKNINGNIYAMPVKGNGSGDLVNLTKATAFLELPSDKTIFKKGEVYTYYTYSSF